MYKIKIPHSEKGSAMVITTMVMVVLTVLGLSFMLFSSTEQQISVNHRDSTQIIFVAEGVANVAEKWFNHPTPFDSGTGDGNPMVPVGIGAPGDTTTYNGNTIPVELINVESNGDPLRWIDYDWDGTIEPPGSGSDQHTMGPYTGNSGHAFKKPFMGPVENTFWGSEEHPDLIVSQSYLDKINTAFLGGVQGDPGEMQIVDIRIYRPPLDVLTSSRLGIATIKVTAAKMLNGKNGVYRAAQRHVKIVIGEFSLMDEVVAISADAGIAQTGSQGVHWGCEQTEGDIDQGTGAGALTFKIWSGMFYKKVTASYQPPQWDLIGMEWFCGVNNDYIDIDDPWFMLRCSGNFVQEDQSCAVGSCVSGDYETDSTCYSSLHVPIEGTATLSVTESKLGGGDNDGVGFTNVFQFVDINMPEFDYKTWKNIVLAGLQSSESDKFHFFDWNGSEYVERGSGLSGDVNSFFEDDPYEGIGGVYFFDTTNGEEPKDTTGDDYPDNLTDSFTVQHCLFRGIFYICADDVKFTANAKTTIPVKAPGEAYSDGLPFIFYPDDDTGWVYNNYDPNGNAVGVANLSTHFCPAHLAGTADPYDLDDHRDIIWDCITDPSVAAPDGDPVGKLNTFRRANGTWDFIDWDQSYSAGAVNAMDHATAPGHILDETKLVFKGSSPSHAADFDPTVDPHEPFANFVYPAEWMDTGNAPNAVTLDYRPIGGEYPVPDRGIGGGDTNPMEVIVDGVMFIAGSAEGTGNPNIYGSLTLRDTASLHGNVEIWFNQELVNGMALDTYGLPSVIRLQKQTDM